MKLTTLQDIQDCGFVPYQYTGIVSVANGSVSRYGVIQTNSWYVHASVAESLRLRSSDQRTHPVVKYHPETGWFADWGAMQFQLRTWTQLIRFCQQFEYTIDQPIQ